MIESAGAVMHLRRTSTHSYEYNNRILPNKPITSFDVDDADVDDFFFYDPSI